MSQSVLLQKKDYPFLQGGGEMGALTRSFDWSKTILGEPDTWPQSLKTTISIVLNSKFPMFLFWGQNLICFYNDAYRPSLGQDGKHPSILGIPGADAWTEIWAIIKPLIDQVLAGGEATWSKDQLIPIYRNGKIEDVYWTFSYSPVSDESGKPAGVFVTCSETTEQVLAREKIEENEYKLERILSQLPAPVVVLRGASQAIETVNDALLTFWNKQRDEVMGRPMLDVFPELKNQPFPAQWKHVYETGETIINREKPVSFNQPDGTKRLSYVDYYYQPLRDENGAIVSVLATVIDITDKVNSRKQLEDNKAELQAINEELAATNEELSSTNEELNESRNRLQSINNTLIESQDELQFALQAADLGTWDLNPATNRFAGNARLKSWFGLPPDAEIALQKATDMIDSKDRGRVIAAIQEAMTFASGGNYDVEYTIIHPVHNIPRYVRAKGKAVFNEQQQPIRFSGTLHDITEERLASAKLIETNQRLEFALDAGRLGSYDLNLITGNMYCTPQCKANYGLANDAVFNFGDLMQSVLPEYHEYVNKQVQASIINHSVYNAEYQVQWPDGTLHWISVAGKPTYNEEDTAISMAGVTLDITERKLDDIRKNDFIGMVSHELKTPLTSLAAFIQILNEENKNKEEAFASGLLQKAGVQVKKMSTLINGFLNISRFESGKIQIVKQDFDLAELLTEMIAEIKLTTSGHTIQLEPCEQVRITADRDKIGSVVSNLLSNAVKYAPQGKAITVNCRVINNNVQISVRDEGMGIKPEDQQKLFDRYYRVESNSSQHISGFGIGLYLSAEIIHRHDGKIWVESEAGEGATFYFTLPLAL